MLVINHVIVSGVVGGIWYYIFKSMPEALICFFSGFLIDIDHFLDYCLNHSFTFNLGKVYKACREFGNFKRLYLIFHSFEFTTLIWLIGILSYPNRIWLAIATGITQHLMFDQFFNPMFPFAYFLTYRISKRFKADYILRRVSRSTF